MRTVRRSSFLVPALLLLAACSSKPAPISGTGAVQAVLPVLEAVGHATALSGTDSLLAQSGRPAAMMGVFAADYLDSRSLSLAQSALMGIRAQQRIDELNDPVAGSAATVYSVMQELQLAANLDVSDLLNRSTDRAKTLDDYVRDLNAIIQKGARTNDALAAEIVSLTDERKTVQANITALGKSQKEATQSSNFQVAGEIQAKLDAAQARQDEIDRQLQADKEAQKALGTIGGVAVARKTAIEANREVLIAGLKVVDLPETGNLGVLQTSSGSRSSKQSPFRDF